MKYIDIIFFRVIVCIGESREIFESSTRNSLAKPFQFIAVSIDKAIASTSMETNAILFRVWIIKKHSRRM